jgi:hypothetical protein
MCLALWVELCVFVRLVTERSSPTSGTSPHDCHHRPGLLPFLIFSIRGGSAEDTRWRDGQQLVAHHRMEPPQPTACMSGAVVRPNGCTSRLASASVPQDARRSRDEGDVEKSVSTVADGLHSAGRMWRHSQE